MLYGSFWPLGSRELAGSCSSALVVREQAGVLDVADGCCPTLMPLAGLNRAPAFTQPERRTTPTIYPQESRANFK